MSSSQHVVVVGGGVIGLCCAHYASLAGHRVTVVERGAPDHDSCSLGNAGMVVPSHFIPLAAPGAVALGLKWMWNPASPFYIRPRLDASLLRWGWRFFRAATAGHVARSAPLLRDLSLASRALFQELAGSDENSFGLVQKGLIMLCRTAHALDEEAHVAEAARELGIPAQVLDPAGVARLDPQVRYQVAGGVHFPQDCHLDPAAFTASLTRNLQRRGAEFRFGSAVSGWRCEGGRVTGLVTSQGEVRGDSYVLALGSDSPATVRGLDLDIPMQAGKGYSLTLQRPPGIPSLCSILTEARVAVTPMGQGLRIGGTMEIAGMDTSINPVRVRGIVNAVPGYLPDFRPSDFNDVPVWRGLRPCSPDGLPYLGRARSHPNLVVATGHAMMGLSLGPVTGRLVAELLEGRAPSLDISLLHPDRFR